MSYCCRRIKCECCGINKPTDSFKKCDVCFSWGNQQGKLRCDIYNCSQCDEHFRRTRRVIVNCKEYKIKYIICDRCQHWSDQDSEVTNRQIKYCIEQKMSILRDLIE